jgi:uncharacterized lipoprotein NlpE involved in copper resistance
MHIRRIAIALLLGAVACDESPVSLPEAAGVTVAAPTMALSVGDAAPVAAQVVDQDGRVMQGQAVVYSTDNASVATVTTDGMVSGMGPGTANVSAAHGGSSATVKVTVTAQAMEVKVPNATMALVVGDAAPAGAQVVDGNGRVVQGAAVVYSTDNPAVATVGTDGLVRGVTPGTTTIRAAYGASSATVQVTVAADRRNELQSLDVLADSLVADRRAGVQVVSVRATNGLGQAICPTLSLRSSNPAVVTAQAVGACRIEVTPLFPGEATITAEAEGQTDTFGVRVTSSGQIAFFSQRPTAEQLVAGGTASYTVKVLDQMSRPVANQTVNFDVPVGSLSASQVTTDSTGTATIQWTLPTHLGDWGQNQSISFRALLPNGTVASHTETVFINGASLAEVVLYRSTGSGWTRLDAAAINVPGSYSVLLGARGLDQYGNVRVEDFTFSFTGNGSYSVCGGSGGSPDASGLDYICFYSPRGSIITMRATAPGGQNKSVQVTFN